MKSTIEEKKKKQIENILGAASQLSPSDMERVIAFLEGCVLAKSSPEKPKESK